MQLESIYICKAALWAEWVERIQIVEPTHYYRSVGPLYIRYLVYKPKCRGKWLYELGVVPSNVWYLMLK